MSAIYEWVRNLVFFLILTTMMVNLLPDKKYERYLRLFVGVVFLMLVLSPFSDISGVGEQMAEAFSRITFQNDAKMLRREMEDADGKRMKKLVENYENVLETEMRAMAEERGLLCMGVEVALDEKLDGGTFGRVVSVDMTVEAGEKTESRSGLGREIAELKQTMGEYYGVEEGDIAIHLESK